MNKYYRYNLRFSQLMQVAVGDKVKETLIQEMERKMRKVTLYSISSRFVSTE